MSNVISYIFEVQDKMTAELRKISRSMQDVVNKTKRQQKAIADSFSETNSSVVQGLQRLKATVSGSIYWKSYVNDLDMVSNKLRQVHTQTQQFSQKMYAMRGQALFVSLPTGLFAKSAYQQYASLEQTQIQMGVTFGETAKSMMENADKVADSTALSRQGVYGLYSDLANQANLGNKEILKFSNNLINTIYGLGGGQNFNNIVAQLIQGLGKGRLELQDIKSLQASKIPIVKMIAETMGKSNAEIYELIGEKGGPGITKEMIFKAFELYGEKYKNQQEIFAKSAEGSIQRLGEAYGKLQEKFGKLLHEIGVGEMINSLINGMTKLTEYIHNMSPATKKFVGYFTLFAITLPPILLAVGLLASSVGFLAAGAAIVFSPWIIVPALITTLTALIIKFRDKVLLVGSSLTVILMLFKRMALTNPFGLAILGITAFYELLKKIPTIMDAIYEKFAFVRKIGDWLGGGGLADSERVQRPQNAITQPARNDIMSQIVKGNIQQSSQVDMNIKLGNIPKGTSIETRQQSKGVDFLKLGINSVVAGV